MTPPLIPEFCGILVTVIVIGGYFTRMVYSIMLIVNPVADWIENLISKYWCGDRTLTIDPGISQEAD
jgi:hypothetical protein